MPRACAMSIHFFISSMGAYCDVSIDVPGTEPSGRTPSASASGVVRRKLPTRVATARSSSGVEALKGKTSAFTRSPASRSRCSDGSNSFASQASSPLACT